MKFALIILSFLVISCGSDKMNGSLRNGVGEQRAVNAFTAIPNNDRNGISQVCNALAQKASVLPNVVGTTLLFSASQTDCTGNVNPEASVETVIQSNGLNFVLRRKSNNQEFIFPDLETNTQGLLADYCGQINILQNPLVSGTSASYITTSGIDPNNCTPASGEVCVQIERASLQGDFYVVHTKDWLRVRISSPTNDRIGFYTQRKKTTRGICGDNEVMEMQATLR